jgi:hypothetical protein
LPYNNRLIVPPQERHSATSLLLDMFQCPLVQVRQFGIKKAGIFLAKRAKNAKGIFKKAWFLTSE